MIFFGKQALLQKTSIFLIKIFLYIKVGFNRILVFFYCTVNTIGGGYLSATDANSSTVNDKANEVTVAISAVTGDLTVGVGYSDGYSVASNAAGSKTDAAMEVDDATAVTAGVKYVSGDITFALGVTDGEAIDAAVGSDGTANEDTYESVGGSIDYVVAPGVTATLGWSDVSTGNDGSSSTGNSGSSWYLGANVSF